MNTLPDETKFPPFLRDLFETQRATASIAKRGFSRNEVIIRREKRSDEVIGWIVVIREVEVASCEILRVPHTRCNECCRDGAHSGAGGNNFLIEEFDVAPDLQRMGVERILYDWIERKARRDKIHAIWLTVNPGSEGFWQKMGFNSDSNVKPSEYACKPL